MVGFRVFDVGLLVVWLVWFFRLRDDGDEDPPDEGGGGGGGRPRARSARRAAPAAAAFLCRPAACPRAAARATATALRVAAAPPRAPPCRSPLPARVRSPGAPGAGAPPGLVRTGSATGTRVVLADSLEALRGRAGRRHAVVLRAVRRWAVGAVAPPELSGGVRAGAGAVWGARWPASVSVVTGGRSSPVGTVVRGVVVGLGRRSRRRPPQPATSDEHAHASGAGRAHRC